ncbi:sugar ABC transporter permease [Ktedonosporobacter rubrisoli]|uniref:Sugar ABC transporter permease n=1 Tax=Ktedonosporobacter rubrisoli TaxID=2509675 RepID=A0A4P6K3Z3_KTERU|nr:sugar ABC transporter permease [Ktedonosporobacter rubrisoli]QBD82998.1 sugar ABC transporter permease [Ktedonosporobacter rubrisoli]
MYSARLTKYGFLFPALLLLLILMIYPLGYAINASLHSYFLGQQTGFTGLTNWADAFHDTLFWNSIGLTLLYSVIAIPIEMVLGIALALLITSLGKKMPRRISEIVRSILIIPFIIMPVVSGIVWKLLFLPQYGFLDYLFRLLHLPPIDWLGNPLWAVVAIIFMDFWIWIPFIFLIVTAGLQALPDEPFEAAQIDGASFWQTLFQVTLPLLSSVILVALSLRTIDAIRIFDQVYSMTGGGPGAATTFVSLQLSKTAFSELNFGLADAELFLVLALMLIIVGGYYVFMGRKYLHG